ncbi:MAG TPA: aromatic-ring-hydroxylating dioxygenase subunit beta [Stellaceae bacterium]|jgi:anthranilate 1,2-dioxygenase small subunit|nr:aromatic-ring-hydroxylating dioxygenase subunit beta [Stellaceae bacterium]
MESGRASAGLRELRLEIEEFNAEYAAVLDAGRVQDWPQFFTEDAIYRVTGRENADAGLPVGLVYCEGIGMMRDRALAISRTTMFAPRYLLHQVTNTRVLALDPSGEISAEANYALFETLVDEKTTLQQVGRYHDRFVRQDGRLKLKARHCVYDSLIIDTALIYPV